MYRERSNRWSGCSPFDPAATTRSSRRERLAEAPRQAASRSRRASRRTRVAHPRSPQPLCGAAGRQARHVLRQQLDAHVAGASSGTNTTPARTPLRNSSTRTASSPVAGRLSPPGSGLWPSRTACCGRARAGLVKRPSASVSTRAAAASRNSMPPRLGPAAAALQLDHAPATAAPRSSTTTPTARIPTRGSAGRRRPDPLDRQPREGTRRLRPARRRDAAANGTAPRARRTPVWEVEPAVVVNCTRSTSTWTGLAGPRSRPPRRPRRRRPRHPPSGATTTSKTR